MSLKDNWKNAGVGIGKSFAGVGRSIVKSVKAGVDKAAGEENNINLKESWSEVGHNFGDAGKSLGKAAAGTVRKVADKVDPEDRAKTQDGETEDR
ncbi:MAG: hypothetical protein J6X30_00440 [Clostridia bacterium]|nr:hypothetical protein [Clostridia bacterium]